MYLCRDFQSREMNIDLFSEMVRDLILDNDEVVLPGLGTFVSEVMPSTFSDKGYTINPPYRRLSFRQRWAEDDRMLAEFYSAANGTDPETSGKILSEFISGLRNTLQTKKMVVFPGLGRLRATRENTFFFIADEDLDIYPYGVGLEPVSLKTHEETPDEVARGVAEFRKLVADATPVKESAASVTELVEVTDGEGSVSEVLGAAADKTCTGEKDAEADRTDVGADKNKKEVRRKAKNRGWRLALIMVAGIIGLALGVLGIFLLLANVAPDFIDSILYTPDELRIINH